MIAVIGLGYVGLPLAILFSKKYKTIGFDINSNRIEELSSGYDRTKEVSDYKLKSSNLSFTSNIKEISNCTVFIVAVPTPIDNNNNPDLTPIINATNLVASVIKRNDLVIYESTVYPGVTEDICGNIISKLSGFKLNIDFFLGYSPERINPADKDHPIEKIVKITSGSTPAIADKVDCLYKSVLEVGTYKASSIKVAEAAKVIENTQRDVNIALINEFAKVFNTLGISTKDILDAAASKWNFIKLQPGLVGGHCISVDPYYLIQKAESYGIYPRLMTEARRINDSMPKYVVSQILEKTCRSKINLLDSKILIVGFSFKENCPDIRNTKVLDLFNLLKKYTKNIVVFDPVVDTEECKSKLDITIEGNFNSISNKSFDICIYAVNHQILQTKYFYDFINKIPFVYDIKMSLPKSNNIYSL